MRPSNVLVSLLVAGCLVPANRPPQQVSQSPAPERVQVDPYWQPPSSMEQSEPQPPPPQTPQNKQRDAARRKAADERKPADQLHP